MSSSFSKFRSRVILGTALAVVSLMLSACGLGLHDDGIDDGLASPTVYYYPVIDESSQTCSAKVSLHDRSGQQMAMVCPQTRHECMMQGSCKLTIHQKTLEVSYASIQDGEPRFKATTPVCAQGLGRSGTCLDAYYSIAADPEFHRMGEVIYFSSVAGTILPNGDKHSGYFVVRDTGSGIRGRRRFDFFVGAGSHVRSDDPFVLLGLSNRHNHIPYEVVTGSRADQFRAERGFEKATRISKY